jgi:hypothetical protein
MTEEFRDIPGYEGLYQVSNLGTVISMQNNKTIIMKHTLGRQGRRIVRLHRNREIKAISVANLVATAFKLPNPKGYKTARTKDGDPSNLCVDNLEWRSPEHLHTPESEAKRWATRKAKMAKKDYERPDGYDKLNKKVTAYSPSGKWAATFKSIAEATRMTGITGIGQSLLRGCNAGGYHWERCE